MSDRTPETPTPTLADACRDLLGLWPLSGYALEAYCEAALIPALRAALGPAEAARRGGPTPQTAALRAHLQSGAAPPPPETPTLAEAARTVLGLWDVSDTRPAAPSRVAAGYEALRAALAAHEAAGAARLAAAVRAPAQADPLAAEVARLQDEVGRLRGGLAVLRQNAQWMKTRAAALDPGGPWHKEFAEIERGCAALRGAP